MVRLLIIAAVAGGMSGCDQNCSWQLRGTSPVPTVEVTLDSVAAPFTTTGAYVTTSVGGESLSLVVLLGNPQGESVMLTVRFAGRELTTRELDEIDETTEVRIVRGGEITFGSATGSFGFDVLDVQCEEATSGVISCAVDAVGFLDTTLTTPFGVLHVGWPIAQEQTLTQVCGPACTSLVCDE